MPKAFVPCQYHVAPAGGFPTLVIVALLHCGELLVGFAGVDGIPEMVTVTEPLPLLQQPLALSALM